MATKYANVFVAAALAATATTSAGPGVLGVTLRSNGNTSSTTSTSLPAAMRKGAQNLLHRMSREGRAARMTAKVAGWKADAEKLLNECENACKRQEFWGEELAQRRKALKEGMKKYSKLEGAEKNHEETEALYRKLEKRWENAKPGVVEERNMLIAETKQLMQGRGALGQLPDAMKKIEERVATVGEEPEIADLRESLRVEFEKQEKCYRIAHALNPTEIPDHLGYRLATATPVNPTPGELIAAGLPLASAVLRN